MLTEGTAATATYGQKTNDTHSNTHTQTHTPSRNKSIHIVIHTHTPHPPPHHRWCVGLPGWRFLGVCFSFAVCFVLFVYCYCLLANRFVLNVYACFFLFSFFSFAFLSCHIITILYWVRFHSTKIWFPLSFSTGSGVVLQKIWVPSLLFCWVRCRTAKDLSSLSPFLLGQVYCKRSEIPLSFSPLSVCRVYNKQTCKKSVSVSVCPWQLMKHFNAGVILVVTA